VFTMQAPTNILIIIPNLGRGGAQQVFRDQLHFFATHYNVIGCVFNWDDSFADDRNGSIVSLDVPAGKNWVDKILSFRKRVAAIKKIKKENRIDVSISHLEGADYVNLLSKQNEKVVCWVHGSKSFDENIEGALGKLRKKILIPFTYRKSDLIVTVSEGIRQELAQNFSVPLSKIITIYNGFNLQEISEKARQGMNPSYSELFRSKKVLITHCRLSRQKNLFALLDIFKETKKRTPATLVILGDGELREDILQHCDKNNFRVFSVWDASKEFRIDYDVYFLGYDRNPYPYLQAASLYLMTSSWEGFPLALCEAMACGVPVMASDCYTGPREILCPELKALQPVNDPVISDYGVLMPLADSPEKNIQWAEVTNSILRNSDLGNKLSAGGKERVKAFDKSKIASRWLDII
jgi:glycosyltransferase involved in cell wall biosynthesis